MTFQLFLEAVRMLGIVSLGLLLLAVIVLGVVFAAAVEGGYLRRPIRFAALAAGARGAFANALTTALEGFEVLRHRPGAARAWICLWLGALSLTAMAVAFGGRAAVVDTGARRGLADLAGRLGPFAAVFIVLLLLAWAMTTVAAFRAVLRPRENRFFFLRIGADEARLAMLTLSALVLVLVFGGLPAFLLLALATPFMQAAPALARDIATLGAIATVCLDVWLAVRLSLIAVETFAERRFHLTAYWPLTRGHFWYLFLCYLICFVLLFGLAPVFAIAGVMVEVAAKAIGTPEGLDLPRRLGLLGLAGVLAMLTSGFFVVTSTLFCACQAHAFRAILAARAHRPRPPHP